MSFNRKEAKQQLFGMIPSHFVDPATGHAPNNEIELSALLAFYHQVGQIDWTRVNLYLPSKEQSGKTADELFTPSGALLTEYPLFAQDKLEVDAWGSMPADLLHISEDRTTVILVENKIGSGFTSGGDNPRTGQLGRQAEYLYRSQFAKCFLILLSTRAFFDAGWYRNELQNSLSYGQRSSKVSGYLVEWEEVLSSISVQGQ